ncbi:hypothetical protein AC812_11455 [Bellilinea caldifistulae]|uniref:Uncharacterized protein n=1 Tax=Bellilinea caldifistulae TaxID=360411 RepID=A0A0P6XGM7_9CHLR|nr:hypothetical protein AC812_11455 [Bellilinea caldifistulae]
MHQRNVHPFVEGVTKLNLANRGIRRICGGISRIKTGHPYPNLSWAAADAPPASEIAKDIIALSRFNSGNTIDD